MSVRHAKIGKAGAACGKLVKRTGAELLGGLSPTDPTGIRFEPLEGRIIMPNTRKRALTHSATTPAGGDHLVLVCIALVVAAIVVGLHVQMGFSKGMASLTGMSLFVGLVGFHAWRRGEAERAALSRALHRLKAEAELVHGHPAAGSPPFSNLQPAPPSSNSPALAPKFGLSVESGLAVDLDEAEVLAKAYAAQAEAPHFEAYRGAPTVPQGESFSDYWQGPAAAGQSGSPVAPSGSIAVTDSLRIQPDLAEATAPGAGATSAVREDDVELLQRRIKDMLYQVTAAEQARELAAAHPSAPTSDPAMVASLAASVETSLDALHAAAQSMRKPTGAVSASVSTAAADAAPVPDDAHVATVRDAIAAGRVDVFLEPILGLGNHAAQHYEVSINLRGPATQDLGTGEGHVLAGRGLLPLFDAVRIERSAIVAERLASRGKTGSVFSRASGEALIEPEFTRNMQMDFVARPRTARQLILTFAQADIRAFRAAEQRAVSALSALGFRFAISGLTDLDMNFGAMAKVGFGFVKLDASVMLEGLPHPGGHIPASDVCRFLADQGFGLIVEGIDSEDTLARVFGFGALMGQGTLFGGRRPVKADVVRKPGQAAA